MLSCFDSTCRCIRLPCSIANDHAKVRCLGHQRQSKWRVWDQKLGTVFSPADPTAGELRDPFSDRPEENNTFGGIDVESKGTKSVQNMSKVSKGTLAFSNAVQRPAAVDIVGINDQVIVQPFMGIPLKEFLHYEVHTEGLEDGRIN